MTSVLFELPRARVGKVDPSATIIEIPRDRGSTVKSSEMENPWGWDQTGKKPPSRDMNISWNHILSASKCFIVQLYKV